MDLFCLEFINSEFRDFRGRWVKDYLRQPAWVAEFLAKWQVQVAQPLDEETLEELVGLRSLLVRIIEMLQTPAGVSEQAHQALTARLEKSTFRYTVELSKTQRLHLVTVPIQRDWNWVQSEIITDFLTLLTDYEVQRLKICANQHCRYIFYDETKSRTRRYCSIEKCANLVKVRRFRAKQKNKPNT